MIGRTFRMVTLVTVTGLLLALGLLMSIVVAISTSIVNALVSIGHVLIEVAAECVIEETK